MPPPPHWIGEGLAPLSHMRKTDLVAELHSHDMDTRPERTVVELRQLVNEARLERGSTGPRHG